MNKVFIVEDSVEIRERLRSAIADIESAELVGESDNQESALKMIKTTHAEIVVLDIHLAQGNGISVLRRIKSTMPGVKVMVLTNHAYPQYQQKCMKLGADSFLDKTKDFSRLAGILRGWIEVSPIVEHAA